MSERVDVAIAGAGPAGLAVAASLGSLGIRARLFERGAAPAWSWEGHYRSLRLHTPRGLSELPGLRLRSATPYPTRDEFLRYCADYARAHALDVVTRCEVTALRRDGESWRAVTTRGEVTARHVVVATGFFAAPRAPEWLGRERFGGRWLAPRDVEAGESLEGCRVLVAGLGSTGADMVAGLERMGARVMVAVEGPLFVAPRELLGANVFRWTGWLPERANAAARRLGPGVSERVERLSAVAWETIQERAFGDLRRLGLRLATADEIAHAQRSGQPPLIGGAWVELLRRGAVELRPEVVRLTADSIEFAGGPTEQFDAILPAIGLEESRYELAGDLPRPLRDGAVEGRPGLWLCGTAPALRHIRRAAQQIANAIAGAMRA